MKTRIVLIGLLIHMAIGTATPHPSGEGVASLGQLVTMSRLIVDGTVAAVLPAIHSGPDNETVETHSRVLISEVLLHLELGADGLTRLVQTPPAGSYTILLAQWGGKAAWREDPLVKQGERYILFLTPDDRTEPPNTSRLPRYHAVGVWSGKVKVENGKVRILPSAAPSLREYDNTDLAAFIAVVRQWISLWIPKIQHISRPGQ